MGEGETELAEVAEGAAAEQLRQIGVCRTGGQRQLLRSAALLLLGWQRFWWLVFIGISLSFFSDLVTYNLLEVVLPLAELLVGGPPAGGGHQRGDDLLLQLALITITTTFSLSPSFSFSPFCRAPDQLHLEEVAEGQLAGGVVAQRPQQTGVQRLLAQETLRVEALPPAAAVEQAFQL